MNKAESSLEIFHYTLLNKTAQNKRAEAWFSFYYTASADEFLNIEVASSVLGMFFLTYLFTKHALIHSSMSKARCWMKI